MSRKRRRKLQERRLRAERRQERVEAALSAGRAFFETLREWIRSPVAALVFFAVFVTAIFTVAIVFGP